MLHTSASIIYAFMLVEGLSEKFDVIKKFNAHEFFNFFNLNEILSHFTGHIYSERASS